MNMSAFGDYQTIRADHLEPGEAHYLLDPNQGPTVTHIGFGIRDGTVQWEKIEDVPTHTLFTSENELQPHIHGLRFVPAD